MPKFELDSLNATLLWVNVTLFSSERLLPTLPGTAEFYLSERNAQHSLHLSAIEMQWHQLHIVKTCSYVEFLGFELLIGRAYTENRRMARDRK